MKTYLLFYDNDYGDRENWSTFYTPVEAYATEELRQKRIDFLTAADQEGGLEFHTLDIDVSTTENVEIPEWSPGRFA